MDSYVVLVSDKLHINDKPRASKSSSIVLLTQDLFRELLVRRLNRIVSTYWAEFHYEIIILRIITAAFYKFKENQTRSE